MVGSRKKDTTPSKSFPHHFSSCLNLVLYFPLDWLSPIREEYVANITPFFTLPFSFDDIFAYLNYRGEKKLIQSNKYKRNEADQNLSFLSVYFRRNDIHVTKLTKTFQFFGCKWSTLFRAWTSILPAPMSLRSLSASTFKSFDTLNLKHYVKCNNHFLSYNLNLAINVAKYKPISKVYQCNVFKNFIIKNC